MIPRNDSLCLQTFEDLYSAPSDSLCSQTFENLHNLDTNDLYYLYSGATRDSLCLQAFEDLYKHVPNDLQDLMIVVVEGHFEIKANKLCQVTVCVGVLCTEHWQTNTVGSVGFPASNGSATSTTIPDIQF